MQTYSLSTQRIARTAEFYCKQYLTAKPQYNLFHKYMEKKVQRRQGDQSKSKTDNKLQVKNVTSVRIINNMDQITLQKYSPSRSSRNVKYQGKVIQPESATKSCRSGSTADKSQLAAVNLWNFQDFISGQWDEIKQIVIAAESAVQSNQNALLKLKRSISAAKSVTWAEKQKVPYTEPCDIAEIKELEFLLEYIKSEDIDQHQKSYASFFRNLDIPDIEQSSVESDQSLASTTIKTPILKKKQSITAKVLSNGLELIRGILVDIGLRNNF